MMRLSLLRAVVDTLAEDGSCVLADEALPLWGPGAGGVRYLRTSANVVFGFLGGDGAPYVLRLTPAERCTAAAVGAELRFVRGLASAGVAVAEPVTSASGDDVHTVATPIGPFHASVFHRLVGDRHEVGDLTPAQLVRWGGALGRLHRAARGRPGHDRTGHDRTGHGRPGHGRSWHGRPSWSDRLPTLPPEERVATDLLNEVTERLTRLPAGEDHVGLIHGDFELDNVIWVDDRPWAIDFDDCAHHRFSADIAFALRDLRHPHTGELDVRSPAVRAFLHGYRGEHDLPDAAIDELPLMLLWHDLVSFGLLLRVLDLPADDADPGWLDGLRDQLLHLVHEYRNRFVATVAPPAPPHRS